MLDLVSLQQVGDLALGPTNEAGAGLRAGAGAKHVVLADVIDYPFVRLNSGGDKDSFIDKALEDQGLNRRTLFEVPYFSAAFSVVASNHSLMILPEHIADTAMQHLALDYRPLDIRAPENHYHLCWHELHDKDPAHAWLRECIAEEMKLSDYSPN